MGGPTSSNATAGIALRMIWPLKPSHYFKVETPSVTSTHVNQSRPKCTTPHCFQWKLDVISATWTSCNYGNGRTGPKQYFLPLKILRNTWMNGFLFHTFFDRVLVYLGTKIFLNSFPLPKVNMVVPHPSVWLCFFRTLLRSKNFQTTGPTLTKNALSHC
jgi:hypothetical protein